MRRLFVILILIPFKIWPQVVTADFQVKPIACISEDIKIENLSINAARYEWDFCEGDFAATPTGALITSSGVSVPEDIEIVFDGSNWFGFVVGKNSNSITRLEFGADINSTPNVVNLGNVGSTLISPTGIQVVSDNNQWYGFVYNSGGNLITRIDFGASLLNNNVSAQVIVNGAGAGDGGLDVSYSNGKWFVMYAGRNVSAPFSYVGIARLDVINSIPSAADIKAHNISNATYLAGCKLVLQNNNWFGYFIANNGPISIQRLAFGSDLFNSFPTITELTDATLTSRNPYGIEIAFDAGEYFAFVTTLSGDLLKINLGADLLLSPVSFGSIGELGVLSNTLKLRFINDKSNWVGFTFNYSTSQVYRINFSNSFCATNPAYSTSRDPVIFFSGEGQKVIGLKAFKSPYEYDEISKALTVENQIAPDISFSSLNNCVQNNVDFTSTNSSGDITAYSWDFGDGNTSSSNNASHIYSTASTYAVLLEVTAANGCQNFAQDTLQIFNPPQANFNLPAVTPFCSNQNYTFTNTSTFDNGSSPTWQWSVNGANVATTQDLSYLIPSTAAQNIMLTASIPGCSSQSTQSILTVQDGPLANFSSPATGCVGTSIPFTNTTTGTVTSYAWDFGDGNNSSQANATNTYALAGNFAVTLTAYNVAGCQNFVTKNFPVYDEPVAAFSPSTQGGAAPLTVTFNNGSIADSYFWQFGDTNNSTSSDFSPEFTYTQLGQYKALLTASNIHNCVDTVSAKIYVNSQSLQADFSILPQTCLQENTKLTNLSTGAISYEWDFCEGDFAATPTGALITSSGVSVPEDIEIVFDGSNWFGFVVGKNSNSITRLEFGADINSTPNVVNLGNVGSTLISPTGIQVVSDNNQWYGFVYNSGGNLITRIDFGASLLNNNVSAQVIVNGAGAGDGGLDVSYSNGKWFVMYAGRNVSAPFSYVGIARLDVINSIPSAADIKAHNISNATYLAGCKLVLQNNNWFGYFIANNGPISIQRLAFGSDLFNSFPTITELTDATLTSRNPYGIEIAFDAGEYFAFVTTLSGDLLKINLGADLLLSPVSFGSIGELGVLSNTLKLRFINDKSNWVGFTFNYSTSQVYRINFSNSFCATNPAYSTSRDPVIFFSGEGQKVIGLKAFKSPYEYDEISKALTVENQIAPDISFSSLNNCVQNNVDFTSTNSSGDITAYSWDFGDGNTSSSNNASHIYSTASTYAVLLEVTAANGCQNFAQDTLQIFNPPQANFTLPTVSPICSNQNYLFTNTSTFDNGSNPTWQWSVNGANVATTQDLSYLIPSMATQNIMLTASIPGCSTQSTQSILTVQDGPLANFSSPAMGCVGTSIPFTNTTTGTVTSYAWDFGDGNSSSQTNATNTYALAGNFAVTLTAYNVAGCQNFMTKNFPVYSNPQPDFAIEAPPYSCANYPAQFDNNTPPLTDSNVATWAWSFGDAANGTSSQKNPTYTYASAASYNVTLQAVTNFGCSATKQNSVLISPSPQSGFTNTPACVNQNTQFTDASSGSITSYQWVIQSTILTGANPPPYVFTSAGAYPVSLTTTSTNGCKNQVVKNVNVPVPPVMDFNFQTPCTGNATIFQEANPGGADPSVAWNWNFGPGSGTGSPVSYIYATAGIYSVTLSSIRTSGCIYSTSKNVTIYAGPVAAFTPSTQGGAAPLTVTFNNGSIADSYFWQFGDTNNSTSTDFSPEFTYTQLGQYKALLTASNIHSCIDTISTKIYVVIPHIDLAMKNFSLVEDPNSNSLNPLVTISNLGNIPLTNPEVQVDLGGNAVLKEKIMSTIFPGKSIQQTLSLAIVPQTLGYICAEVESNGDINIYNDSQCVSMTNNDVLFYPYPNPAKGQINFDWISSENENVTVTIYKSTGQVAFQQNFQTTQPGINQLAINISSLSSGLYLIQFSGANAKKTFNVMVIN